MVTTQQQIHKHWSSLSTIQGCRNPGIKGCNLAGFHLGSHLHWWKVFSVWEDRKPGCFAVLEDWILTLLLQIKPLDVKHGCISFHPLNFKTASLPHCLPDYLLMCCQGNAEWNCTIHCWLYTFSFSLHDVSGTQPVQIFWLYLWWKKRLLGRPSCLEMNSGRSVSNVVNPVWGSEGVDGYSPVSCLPLERLPVI